jgi:cation diffusion facilitator family transporter
MAILIFGIGGGISVYEGIIHLRHPHPLEDPTWNYVVLGLAALFESGSLMVAYREFRTGRGKESILEAMRTSKDPSLFTVLLEDTAALAGLRVAFAGVALAHATGNPVFDAAASIVIGIILALVAAFLVYESRGLLVGESVDPRTLASIRRVVESDPAVERMGRARAMHLGPCDVLLTMEVRFREHVSARDLERTIARLEQAIRAAHPEIRHIFIEAGALTSPHDAGAGEVRAGAQAG